MREYRFADKMNANQSRRLQLTRKDQYLALEQELRDLENKMKIHVEKQNELQRMLEANKKEWDKLKKLYHQKLKERDQKKEDERM